MLRYALGRLAQMIPLLFLASLATFLLLRLGQGDPAMAYLRLSSIPPSDQALAAVRSELGLDRPLAAQYLSWLWRALHLDFGRSYVTGLPVLEELLHYLPNTLKLGGLSLALTASFSLPLGFGAALRRDSLADRCTRALTLAGAAMPNFWLGYLLIWLFSVKLRWLPSMGLGGLSHMIMPAVTASLMSLCADVRLVRASLLEHLHCRWALYARCRGLPERAVVGRHVAANALGPIVTALGMQMGQLFGGAVVAETIFSWPGVGRFALSAIANRDYPVLQCFLVMTTALFMIVNLVIDLVCAWLDPRIRLDERPERGRL